MATKAELEQEVAQAKAAFEKFLKRAHDMADRVGHCSEYDRIVAFAAKDIDLPEGWRIVKRNGHFQVTRRIKWVVEYDEVVNVNLNGYSPEVRTVARARKEAADDYYSEYSWMDDKSDLAYIQAASGELEAALQILRKYGVDGDDANKEGNDNWFTNFDVELHFDTPKDYTVE